MPFKSEKQRKYLYAKHPEVAKKFASEEKTNQKKPPEHMKPQHAVKQPKSITHKKK